MSDSGLAELPEIRILTGDSVERLRELPDGSVHSVVTSPPYWGLRTYTNEPGMIGMEPTIGMHIERLLEVFREVRRVLRNDGAVWLNYGDVHNSGTSAKRRRSPNSDVGYWQDDGDMGNQRVRAEGFKPKDLLMLPARVAIALQDDGWWIRQEVIWHKRNPTPESVTDRPTSATEKIFLMSKSLRYYYDNQAVRTPLLGTDHDRIESRKKRANPGTKAYPTAEIGGVRGILDEGDERAPRDAPSNGDEMDDKGGANLRNVWKFSTSPFPGAHSATMPPKIAARCIELTTSERGCCSRCGAPWRRVTRRVDSGWDGSRYGERVVDVNSASGGTAKSTLGSSHGRLVGQSATVGWKPSCRHDAPRVPCTVLDPFGGPGTTGLAASRLGRSAILVEISPFYVDMATNRIRDDAPLLSRVIDEGLPAGEPCRAILRSRLDGGQWANPVPEEEPLGDVVDVVEDVLAQSHEDLPYLFDGR